MPDNRPKPLYVKVSVEVSDSQYGSSLTYQTSTLMVHKDHPEVPLLEATESVRTLLESAFNLPQVVNAYAIALAEPDADDGT
jgi:hypothetical protein